MMMINKNLMYVEFKDPNIHKVRLYSKYGIITQSDCIYAISGNIHDDELLMRILVDIQLIYPNITKHFDHIY